MGLDCNARPVRRPQPADQPIPHLIHLRGPGWPAASVIPQKLARARASRVTLRTPQLTLSQAVKNFFKERSRVRNVVAYLPGKKAREWDAISVCGAVYKSCIFDVVKDVSGLDSRSQHGWLAEYVKARKAVFATLTPEQLQECEKLVTKWNRAGIPLHMKKKYT